MEERKFKAFGPTISPDWIKQPVTAYIMHITKEIAEYFLTFNIKNNRSINKHTVDMYAQDIRNGKFGLNPDAIAFNTDGELFNGQHRLTCAANTGCEFDALVVFNFPMKKEDFLNVDTGRKRNVRNGLEIMGIDRNDIIMRSADIASSYIRIKYKSGVGGSVSNNERLALIESNKSIMEWAIDIGRHGARSGKGGRIANRIPSVIMVAMIDAKLCGEDEEALRKFAQIYCDNNFDGTDAYAQRYALELRNAKNVIRCATPDALNKAKSYLNAFCRNYSKCYMRDNLYPAKLLEM